MQIQDMKIVRDWHVMACVAEKAHIKSAAQAERMNKLLGIPATILSAVVGSAVFASLGDPSKSPGWATVLVGGLGIIAAGLTGLQTFLRYAERAENHRKFFGRYGMIRRQLEELLATYTNAHPCEDTKLHPIEREMNEVDAAAPSLSQHLYDRLAREIHAEEARRGPETSASRRMAR
ncbi:MAG TPA: SLATT domain-containing protein [Acetobacteraceae bacterium]|nr:SLATT domain-containing protein [Acetobacteraceae bacterium]